MGKPLDRTRIRTVIDALKEGPKTWSELAKRTPEKSLNRILKEYLEYWDLVYKDEDGRWSWYLRKRPFTPHDLDLALKHSRYIIFGGKRPGTEKKRQGVPMGIGLLVEFSLHQELDIEFFQHLKQGYPEIYSEFETFDRLFLKRGRIMKEVLGPCAASLSDKEANCMLGFDVGYFLKDRENQELPQVSQDNINDLKRLETQIVDILEDVTGKLATVFLKVENGIPLMGHCQYCPHNEIELDALEGKPPN